MVLGESFSLAPFFSLYHSCSDPQVGSATLVSYSATPITSPGWKFPCNPDLDFFLCCMYGSKDSNCI